jgi:hypothetical protein
MDSSRDSTHVISFVISLRLLPALKESPKFSLN